MLTRLAELYECSVPDLVTDCADYRSLDHAQRARQGFQFLAAVVSPVDPGGNHDPLLRGTDLTTLLERVRSIEAHDLARAASLCGQGLDTDLSRRSLLLKLSAGLALAAATPAVAWAANQKPTSERPGTASSPDLSGIWHSRYTYFSSGRDQGFEVQHYLVLRHEGSTALAQSLPDALDSKLALNLSLERSVATGTWREQTSPTGYYRGATYHGSLQLLIDPAGRSMAGKWVGFGKNLEMNIGDWDLTWVEGFTSPQITPVAGRPR